MITPFYIGQGDRLPYYRIVVRDEDGVVDLSDVVAVRFYMKRLSTASVLLSAAPAFITDSVRGEAEYRWAAADTDVPGDYAVSFEFETASGPKFTLPRNAVAKVVVESK